MKTLLFSVLALLVSNTLFAQFELSAEVRPRTEVRDGLKTPANEEDKAAFFTEQRTRLNFDYKEDQLNFRVSLQDIRIWGENSQIFKEEDGNTFLSEAYVSYAVSPKSSFKAGRQILSYDNQRFLGGLEWAQQGRRHDALIYQLKDAENATALDIGVAFNSDDDVPEPANVQSPTADFYSVNGNYKNMQFAHYNKQLQNLNLSLLALNAGYQTSETNVDYKQTVGLYVKTTTEGKWQFSGDAYYQMGELNNNEIKAYLIGGNATYTTSLTPLTFGVEYISGKDGDDTSSTIKHFSPDFGTNHAHNGYMDYFFVGPSNGSVGVLDTYLKTKFPIKKSSVQANLHQFFTGSTQLNTIGDELNKAMGTELDLVYGTSLRKDVSINVGYSTLLATDTLLALRIKEESFNQWGWLMITAKPTLFKN